MKSLSRYDEREDPVVLRKDFVKDHAGVGYYGAKMRSPQELFTNVLKNSVGTPAAGSMSQKVLLFGNGKGLHRPTSSMSKKQKSPGRPISSVSFSIFF